MCSFKEVYHGINERIFKGRGRGKDFHPQKYVQGNRIRKGPVSGAKGSGFPKCAVHYNQKARSCPIKYT